MPKQLDSESFEQAVNSGDTWVVDFWASWCQPCKKLEPIFEEVSKDMEEVKFGKVSMEEQKDIGTKQGVRALPTMIIFKDGEERARTTGVLQKDELKQWVEENN